MASNVNIERQMTITFTVERLYARPQLYRVTVPGFVDEYATNLSDVIRLIGDVGQRIGARLADQFPLLPLDNLTS